MFLIFKPKHSLRLENGPLSKIILTIDIFKTHTFVLYKYFINTL